jgi:hypothetical protein
MISNYLRGASSLFSLVWTRPPARRRLLRTPPQNTGPGVYEDIDVLMRDAADQVGFCSRFSRTSTSRVTDYADLTSHLSSFAKHSPST